MALHHYVITFDSDANEWVLDDDTLTARFPDGNVYDHDNDEWHYEYLGDGKFYPMAEQAGEAISNAVKQLNK
jgi:hypothetical protein